MTLDELATLYETVPDAVLVVGEDGRIVVANGLAGELFGSPAAQLAGRRVEDLVPERFRRQHAEARARYGAAPRTRPLGKGLSLIALRADGAEVPVDVSLVPLSVEGRELVVAAVRESCDRRAAERELRLIAEGTAGATGSEFFRSLVRHLAEALEVRFALVASLSQDDPGSAETLAVWAGGGPGENFTYALAGTPCENVVGKNVCAYPSRVQELFPEDVMLRDLGLESYLGTPLFGASGEPLGLIAVLDGLPMTGVPVKEAVLKVFAARAAAELERLRAEAAVQEANERFELAARALGAAVYDWDVQTGTGFVTEGLSHAFGYEADEIEATYEWWLEHVHPEDRERADRVFREAALTGADYVSEYRYRASDGGYRDVIDRALSLRDPSGRVVRMVGAIVDVTPLKNLEAQLHQSQKLEALGRLAGGIAHDFNNVLSVIIGYAELLLARLEGDPGRADAEQILKAGAHAASLTRQLLAYGRRQALRPDVLDLNGVVLDLEEMLSRLLGEDVELLCRSAPGLGRVLADRSQLEQLIVNLALNARDAMPAGGRLTIETQDADLEPAYAQLHAGVEPGPYVLLAVSDTGVGMDEETRSRIFEPFFTTKGAAGTGLGLATVYGAVKQSGGHVAVESEPGRGTTIRVYLPRAEVVAGLAETADPGPAAVAGRETVLVVEDDDTIRGLVARVLEEHGYSVLAAENGAKALELVDGAAPVELLLTDTVMPELNGPELAERICERIGRIPVLFMSGYAADVAVRRGRLGPRVGFLEKPFTPEALLRRVRDTLDGPARRAA